MERRSFLSGAAALTIMVADGQVWRAFGQASSEFGEGPAFEPWKTWPEDAKQGPIALVHAAILSSNAFNTQPWLFKVSQSRIELYADLRRNLGAFDPYRRELYFSLGCALENLLLAATATGYNSSVTLLPGTLDASQAKPEPQQTAIVELSPGKRATNELYEAIPHRHTNLERFAEKPLPPGFTEALAQATNDDKDAKLFLFTAETDREKLVDTIIGSAELLADPEVRDGTRPWLRATLEEWQNSRDGTYVGGRPKASTLDDYAKLMLSGQLFGLIGVRDRYDRQQTVRAGRLWQRAHLLATARKLAARPANGAVEMIDHEKKLKQEPRRAAQLTQITGDATWQPTFMFYMGYPTVAAIASARRSVHDVTI